MFYTELKLLQYLQKFLYITVTPSMIYLAVTNYIFIYCVPISKDLDICMVRLSNPIKEVKVELSTKIIIQFLLFIQVFTFIGELYIFLCLQVIVILFQVEGLSLPFLLD